MIPLSTAPLRISSSDVPATDCDEYDILKDENKELRLHNESLIEQKKALTRERDDYKAMVDSVLARPMRLHMRQPAFDKLLADGETLDLVNIEDLEQMCRDATEDGYLLPKRERDDEGFVGSRVNGRYEMHDRLIVAVHLPKEIKFVAHDLDFVAKRIDSEDGNAVMWEIERR